MKQPSPKADTNADNVKVICRVRPMNLKEKELLISSAPFTREICTEFNPKDRKAITVYTPLEKSDRDKDSFDPHSFNFDYVFSCEAKQAEVYDISAKPIVNGVLEGFNGCILAYGQTSSGKTFTMQGDLDSEDMKGIIPRIVDALFERIRQSSEKIEFTIKAAMIEIYNEKIKDLLDPSKDNLNVREERQRGVFIESLTEMSIGSGDEVYELMRRGNNNRAVGVTNMNAQSSRSHSIFILQIVMNDMESFSCKTGKLHLVDLAGSEMISKTGATGKTLEEAKNINKSLTMLGRVINALTDGKSEHIPYRDSKLTRILQNSLGGNAKTCLIITASPAIYNASETLSTCRFGMRAKSIKNVAVVNKIPTIAELELIIQRLRKELSKSHNRVAQLESTIMELGGRIPVEEAAGVIFTEEDEDNGGISEKRNSSGKKMNQIIKVGEENKDKVEVIISRMNREKEVEQEKRELEKVHGTELDTLIDQLRKERQRTKTKNEKLQNAQSLLVERDEEVARLKKIINDQELVFKKEKEKLEDIISKKAPEEQPLPLEKTYTEEEVNNILEKERAEYVQERDRIIEKVGTLTKQNIDLLIESEKLTEKVKKMEELQSKDAMARTYNVLQENLNRLNQMYHQKLNQCATAKYDLEMQEKILQRVVEQKDEMGKQIANMKVQMNSLTLQCEQLKEIIRNNIPEGDKILEDPELGKLNPMFISQQNVVKRIRGGVILNEIRKSTG